MGRTPALYAEYPDDDFYEIIGKCAPPPFSHHYAFNKYRSKTVSMYNRPMQQQAQQPIVPDDSADALSTITQLDNNLEL